MGDKKEFICELCKAQLSYKANYYRHKKYSCPVKHEQEKNKTLLAQEELKQLCTKITKELEIALVKLDEQQKIINKQIEQNDKQTDQINRQNEQLDKQKVKLDKQAKLIDTQKEEIDKCKEKLMLVLCEDRTFLQSTHKTSTSTISKSVDALSFLMTHRKNAPELKKITQENAQELLTRENKLYDYLLHFNSENKLDQYIGDIILKYIKKENPEDQSVWNSDVSRLTFLIREIVNESPTWLRDPNGAMFNAKIITPVIDEIRKYLDKCLYSKNPDKVRLDDETDQSDSDSDSDSEAEKSEDVYAERENMRRKGKILGTMETLRSKKFKKSLAEYIASHIPLHKIDKKESKNKKQLDSDQDEKPRKVIKKKPHKKSDSSSDSDQDEKPKKITKKKPMKKSDDTSDDEKPRKVIKKKPNKKSDSSSDSESEKPKKIIKKKPNKKSDSDQDEKPRKIIKRKK
jgi:hypothetical protein